MNVASRALKNWDASGEKHQHVNAARLVYNSDNANPFPLV